MVTLSSDGKMLRQLTSGHWVVMNLLGFDAHKHNVIFAGNEVNPIGCNVFTVNVDTGERIRIDEGGRGWHDASLSGSGKWLLDRYQEPDVPRNIAFVDTRNGQNYFIFLDASARIIVGRF